MRRMLITATLMTVVLTIGFGVIYPFAMTGLAQVLSNHQANGSLITNSKGQVVGSELIGQLFTKPRYFHGRPSAAVSATSPNGYAADASAGSQLGPTNTKLFSNTIAIADQIRKEDGLPPNYVLPADAVSTSASGLDPDISPAYAALQVPRVAKARGLSQDTVRALVQKYTSGRDLGVLGEPRVNVLELNLALDKLKK
ncbi:MAG TPA: potassium-transporting ATPase subunit KdpC [Chloroflexota bacterium]|nr:potassium-transporting ATPase subunit KdpC [Chloroflexota bacterium]